MLEGPLSYAIGVRPASCDCEANQIDTLATALLGANNA